MNIKVERTIHNNKPVIKLLFDYDADLVAQVRTIQGARWSRTMRCQYVVEHLERPRKGLPLPHVFYGNRNRYSLYSSIIRT